MSSSQVLHRGVIALGLVSFFMDMSSELIHSVLPLLLVTELGASAALLGLLEGLAEATAQAVKLLSGTLSDASGTRRRWILWGYGLAALSKPLFPMATHAGWVFAARLTDRIGKGIRGAPRDALIADLTPAEHRGRAFGLRQSMDTWGAVAGPLIAMALLAAGFAVRDVLWVAVAPALLSLTCIVIAVPERSHPPRKAVWPLSRAGIRTLGAPFWHIAALGFALSLTRSSEAFLLLRAHSLGWSMTWVPGVMILMSAVFALAAYPAGVAADRLSRWNLWFVGILAMLLADLCLMLANGWPLFVLGIVCWGLHMAFTQGLLSHWVANNAPSAWRGTAFGCFNLACAAGVMLASVVSGLLWDAYGPSAPFAWGALACCGVAALSLRVRGQRLDQPVA